MTKKEMIFYYNSVWPQYTLGSGERRCLNGSLNYYTILHLELSCERAGKNDEIPHVEAFMLFIRRKKVRWLPPYDAAV